MSTKPRLQNLQLWAADTDEKRKVHESYLNPSVSIYQTLSLLFQHIIIKAFILIYYVSPVLNFMILPQTLWVQLQFHCWEPVHTQTGSRMTACGCRRSCCRERTSSMDRHHWRTFPPALNNKLKLSVKIWWEVTVGVKMYLSRSPCSSPPSDWTWLRIHHRLLNNTGDPAHRGKTRAGN